MFKQPPLPTITVNPKEKPARLIRLDRGLCKFMQRRLAPNSAWLLTKGSIIEFLTQMHLLLLAYQQYEGMTDKLYEVNVEGITTDEPLLDYVIRYHLIAFNPEMRIDPHSVKPQLIYYVETLRPMLRNTVAQHLGKANYAEAVKQVATPF